MRLININTLALEEFWEDQTPPHAILSHTWGKDEVSYEDFQNLRVASKKAGYRKILRACQQAHKDQIGYVWVDTNCIDKRSSAELTEAINSMYKWYQDSRVCYAYLADVAAISREAVISASASGDQDKARQDPLFATFRSSRWFTRGWTLQELLAPKRVIFFSKYWVFIGDRRELAEQITAASRISPVFLNHEQSLRSVSVACKMSWVSRRKTTRREDMAYCMLGLFDINMPLLYGEGDKAFIRLQEEIMKSITLSSAGRGTRPSQTLGPVCSLPTQPLSCPRRT